MSALQIYLIVVPAAAVLFLGWKCFCWMSSRLAFLGCIKLAAPIPPISWLGEQNSRLSLAGEGACSCHLLCSHLRWSSVRLNCPEKVRAPHAAIWKALVEFVRYLVLVPDEEMTCSLWKSWTEHVGESLFFFSSSTLCVSRCTKIIFIGISNV